MGLFRRWHTMWHQEIAISMGSNLQLWIFEMNFEYPKGRRLKPQVGILYPFRTPDSLIVSQKKWSLLNLIYVYSIGTFKSPDFFTEEISQVRPNFAYVGKI